MRNTLILFITIITLLSALTIAQQDNKVTQYKPEDFLNTVNYRGASFSPDQNHILVYSDKGGVYNAYTINVESGEEKQLTDMDESVFAIGYFPNDERILFQQDKGGNELYHLFVRETDGSIEDLTPGENLRASFNGWADDNNSFFVSTNERDNRFFDLYEYDAGTYERELLYQNDEGYNIGFVSPDKKYLTLVKTHTRDNSDIYLYNFETEELSHLTPHEGDVNNFAETFSPCGKWLYYTTNADNEFLYLAKMNLESGETEKVLDPGWDVSYAYFSENGKYFVIGINNDSRTELRVYDAKSFEQVELPDIPDAEITSVRISDDESMMAFYASSSRNPRDLFLYTFEDGSLGQLTTSLPSNINPADLVGGEVVRFTSSDGITIPGILYKPHQASAENKVPALVWVHGGPGGQSSLSYRALIQLLVNHGYVVYAINNRGSSGFGKTFYQLDDRDHGNGDLNDCVESKQMLIETGYVDAEKIGIIGGSYGGFMVLAALAFQPEAFEVGVNLFGVANWLRTLKSIPPYWEAFRKALEKEMGSVEDEEYLKSISPLFHASNIVKPLMVLQGANDPRVLQVESDEIVEKVKANGVPVEYIVFDDEGHGFVKKKNQIKAYGAILDFLDKHLRK